MKRKWDSEDAETQKRCIDEVITRIEEIEGESVGLIAAQEIIDIVTENLAPEIYNKGVRDAKQLLQQRFDDINIDLDNLEQRI
jgi:uncharacterized protein (DUF2164 family)